MEPGAFDLSLSIGGAAGQGIATPGNILARLFTRRGLYLNAYNAYQSIVRGGHIFLTIRISDHAFLTVITSAADVKTAKSLFSEHFRRSRRQMVAKVTEDLVTGGGSRAAAG